MTGRRGARIVAMPAAGVLAAGVLLVPTGRALADSVEPQPMEWPTVAPAEQGNAVEPEPVAWPTLPTSGDTGQASEPQPVQWPSPKGEN